MLWPGGAGVIHRHIASIQHSRDITHGAIVQYVPSTRAIAVRPAAHSSPLVCRPGRQVDRFLGATPILSLMLLNGQYVVGGILITPTEVTVTVQSRFKVLETSNEAKSG